MLGVWGVRTPQVTVNSEIFVRVLFSRNFACAKIRENEILAKCRNDCRILMQVKHALVNL